jgi:hypothetical protein
VNNTDIVTLNTLFKYISVLEAQQTLVDFAVSRFPHLNKKSQEKLHRNIHEQAYPEAHQNKALNTKDAFAALLRGR